MPTYQYKCTDCGTPLEVVQSFSDDALSACPTCGGKLRKVFSAVGVVFKGSGFYRNDSRDSGKAKTAAVAGDSAGAASEPSSVGGDAAKAKGADASKDGSSGSNESAKVAAKSDSGSTPTTAPAKSTGSGSGSTPAKPAGSSSSAA